MLRVRRTMYLLLAAVAVLLLVGAPGLGQSVDREGEIEDGAECYSHHKPQGFRSMDLFPEVVTEVPRGRSFTFQLTIRNPWLHELHDVQAFVNLSGSPGIRMPGEDVADVQVAVEGTFGPAPNTPAARTVAFPVMAGATDAVIRMASDPGQVRTLPRGDLAANDVSLRVESPNGRIVVTAPFDAARPEASREIRLGLDELSLGGAGEWSVDMGYRGAEGTAYRLDRAVFSNVSGGGEMRIQAASRLEPGGSVTVPITLVARDVEAFQNLRYGGIAHAYHDHSGGGTQLDDADYRKWSTMEVLTGSELRIGAAQVTTTNIDTLSPIFRRWGEVLGFAGSFLIIPSLVFGGTFGRGSVDLFNKMFGSPRRRVLFHNSLSFWLLGTSVLHMILLFYEAQFGWSKGLVWGGLALACMIGLGITGATQRSFVAQWGFTRWRFIHFAMGILVFVFVLVHIVADGAHLEGVRAMLE